MIKRSLALSSSQLAILRNLISIANIANMAKIALSPFDAQDADVVLRSSDPEPTDFRVYKNILSLSSSFWRTAFQLPQTAQDSLVEETKDEDNRPIIAMSEAAIIIDRLLRFLYPCDDPSFESIDDFKGVIEVAYKYDMLSSLATLRRTLISPSFLSVRIYAIALHYSLHNEAKEAARYALKTNVVDVESHDELDQITGRDFQRLVQYHRIQGKEALKLLNSRWSLCVETSCRSWVNNFRTKATPVLTDEPDGATIFSSEFLLGVNGSMFPD
ncbi:hypothetical protein QCA50_015063 [Cerrena zonata]|uniref:BTB domain-containing protein n=1 Tax=Cerrena zonata TaxID=2478898 RepID=A0AAW0FLR8_9APHY